SLGPRTYLIVKAPAPARRPMRRAPPPPPPPPRQPPADPPPPPLEIAEPIVVTGSKRGVQLAAYPGAALMVDGRDPMLEGLRGSDALVERVPSVTSTHLGAGRNKLFIRGIADSSFNGPTQATVGQYLGETRLNYNAPDPDLRLYDVRRIEVLPGPQGTLYGAGSLGGIIRILPNPARTDRFEAAAALGASTTWHGAPGGEGAAMANLPIAPGTLGLRLVAYGETEGGYIDDLERGLDDVNRTRIVGGRASLRAEPGNGWTLDLGLAGQAIRGEDAQFADRGAAPLTRRSAVEQGFGSDYGMADLVVSRDWNGLRLVSATGIVRQTLRERYDSTMIGGRPTAFDQRNRITMLSSDTRISRDGGDGGGWLIGASFVSNRSRQARSLGDPGAPQPITGVRNSVWEATLYGEGSVALARDLMLTAGARIGHSRLSGAALDAPPQFAALLAPVAADRQETSILPSGALSWRPDPALLLFLRYQEGFRPGGLAVTGDLVQRFRNDRVATIEGGARYERPGTGGFDAAASIIHTRWSDIQADVVDFSGLPTTLNIGDGEIWTADVRLAWRPLEGLSLDLGAMVNESRVTNPVPTIIITTSSPLPNVARLNARFGADYVTPLRPGLDLRLNASARWVGSSRLGIGPILGEKQGGWLDTRLGVRLETERHAVSLSVTNLADEVGNRFALGSPFTLVERPQITPLRPRSIRIGWEARF
ncbi:MAG: TonB-dependent receptor, partial [Allosphingosinicella sp.]